MRRVVGAVVVGCVLLAGCTAGPGVDDGGPIPGVNQPSPAQQDPTGPELPDALTRQVLAWGDCPAPTAAQGAGPAPRALADGAPWECAELTVPLDYAAPDGETLGIALIRVAAVEGAERIGSLVFNFGGPGGSGVATLPRVAGGYDTLRQGFDLVSFDPRGVGASSPVVCRDGADIDAAEQADPGVPRDRREGEELAARIRELAADCEAAAGPLLPRLRTVDAARDLDLLRQVLGDSQLHYYGASYGTKLGAVYAHLYPGRVGRTVLDAVVDPTRDVVQRALLQTEGFQLALGNYLAACGPTGDCPSQEEIADLLDRLREQPLPAAGPRRLTQSLTFTGVMSALYSEGSWPYLTRALRQALDEGNGALLLAAAEQYNGRGGDGAYRNLHAANRAVNCADFASRPTVDDVLDHMAEFEDASPVFGPYFAWGLLSCAGWPVTGERDQPRVRAEGARPILLLATTGDPATPYAGAERMREALGPGVGVLLTYAGEGHGAYGSGDACVSAAVHAHLLAGATPDDGAECP
ncbi:Carboxylesterase A [Streptomyces sp. enrichment culture]|uniref:alpha/beta hydrolase n=1 Tax=Streptomyces sp. enrichment culture TaxID=1795815 RepID=UPI003F578447